MALGEFSLFTWKSKATQAKEQEDYEKWAFPYGEKQRENLQALLHDVYPKETAAGTLIPFLTCKELYEGLLRKTNSVDETLEVLINKQKKYKQLIRKKEMTTYIALVQADAKVGESCEYPPVEAIRARVEELDRLKVE
ncbi:MAG: hypothetical protein FWH33_00945 [Oscillospiraceae bacterium]|nr:hypothetical protein [Oscillospiraceae bacterium]